MTSSAEEPAAYPAKGAWPRTSASTLGAATSAFAPQAANYTDQKQATNKLGQLLASWKVTTQAKKRPEGAYILLPRQQ
jgi:hypothetical protein